MPNMPASREARYWGHVRYDRSRPTRYANSLTNPDGVTRPSSDRLAYAIAPSSRRSWRSPLVPTNTPARGEARISRAPAVATAPWAARAPTTVPRGSDARSEEHTSELQSRLHLVCRLLLEKKKPLTHTPHPTTPESTRCR